MVKSVATQMPSAIALRERRRSTKALGHVAIHRASSTFDTSDDAATNPLLE
jgi:hypothetical protein